MRTGSAAWLVSVVLVLAGCGEVLLSESGETLSADPGEQPEASRYDRDAVFAGHALRHCDDVPDFKTPAKVDGPLSENAGIARAQQKRAEYGLRSDEAYTEQIQVELGNGAFGFPTTEEEFDELIARNQMELTGRLHEYAEGYPDSFGFSFLDHSVGGKFVMGFTADLAEHRQRLAEHFPEHEIRVVQAPATQAQLQAAQRELVRRFSPSTEPSVVGVGSGSVYLQIMVINPSRADLDALAWVVDPAYACVEPAAGVSVGGDDRDGSDGVTGRR